MRYLGNDTSIVREAVLAATNIVPSEAIYRTDTAPKAGGGSVALTGPYSGDADATIDIEIVGDGGSTPQVSQPVFAGVGNGMMTDVAVADVEPQVLTVTLEDLGTETLSAYTTFQGASLRAKAAGAAGNLISIDVDHSAVVATGSDWSLQDELRQDSNEYVGDHWNFGAVAQEPAGTVPSSAPRIQFGNDPQVYRPYRRYRDGRYVYGFSPAPVRTVPAGTRVRTITGTRTITITDGTDTETLSGLVTLYDALSAIRDDSDLVEVVSPIVNDRLPGGQGITELSERTRSYILSVTPIGNGAVQYPDLAITAQPDAPTETLAIKCVDASSAGAEQWEVRGDVSGLLPQATTGLQYSNGRYVLTIPLPELDPSASSGMLVVEYIPSGTHPEGAPIPSLCVDRPRLGINAQNGSWTYTRVKRPPAECDCTIGEMQGAPRNECLGINDGGTQSVSEESRLLRLQRLTAAVRELVGSNTSPLYSVAPLDVRWIEGSAAIFQECLRTVTGGVLALDPWEASTPYTVDAMREPAVRNGYRYAVKVAGTSGGTAPTWNTTVGTDTTDGGVTWTNIGKTPWAMFDDAYDAWLVEVTGLSGLGQPIAAMPWTAGATFGLATGNYYTVPSARNGWLYYAVGTTGAGQTGSTEPTWPTAYGATILDGTPFENAVTWRAYLNYWVAESTVALNKVINPGVGVLYKATTGGETGATEPTWPADGSSVTDGDVVWEETDAADLPAIAETNMEVYFEKWRTWCTDVLAAAGIERNFDQAGVNGDGCWQDYGDSEYWWAFNGDEPYLPIQDGHYHHEAMMGMDENGKPFASSTKRWGFGPRWGCPNALQVNDQLKITISGVTGAGRGYQQGDTFNVRTNRAEPLPLTGGQTGDDTLTWSVVAGALGRLPDYALVTTAVAPYAWAATSPAVGSIGFRINPGGIRYQLGDKYEIWVEGGQFRWRVNGGAWSSPADIAAAALLDGLSVDFVGGIAPSWAAGDVWSFRAEATSGVDNLRSPTPGECVWTGATTIEIAPAEGETVGLLIAGHRIPSDATITLIGSDDGFSTTPLSVPIPWRRGDIWHAITANHAAYRLTINRSGAARWLYLGASTQMQIRTGITELGRLTKRVRLPSLTARRGLGATIEHEALTQASVDRLLDMLSHAAEHDDLLLAIVPNDGEPDVGLVRYNADAIEITDELGFQPTDPANRLQRVTVSMEAAP